MQGEKTSSPGSEILKSTKFSNAKGGGEGAQLGSWGWPACLFRTAFFEMDASSIKAEVRHLHYKKPTGLTLCFLRVGNSQSQVTGTPSVH